MNIVIPTSHLRVLYHFDQVFTGCDAHEHYQTQYLSVTGTQTVHFEAKFGLNHPVGRVVAQNRPNQVFMTASDPW